MKSDEYPPTDKDQLMLIDLCKADVFAQIEVIQGNRKVIDTIQNRLNKYNKILALLPKAKIYKDVKTLDSKIATEQRKLKSLTIPPEPKEIKEKIVNQGQLDKWAEWMSKPEE